MQTAHTLFPKSTCHTGIVVQAYRRTPKVQFRSATQTVEAAMMQIATERCISPTDSGISYSLIAKGFLSINASQHI